MALTSYFYRSGLPNCNKTRENRDTLTCLSSPTPEDKQEDSKATYIFNLQRVNIRKGQPGATSLKVTWTFKPK